jgi:hypothetical protein
MPRAVLKNGVIVPLEPLPEEWADGKELEVREPASSEVDIDAMEDTWLADMEDLCADSTPEQEKRLDRALAERRRELKDLARREMGLPE